MTALAISAPGGITDRALRLRDRARSEYFAGRPASAIRLARQGLRLVADPADSPAEEDDRFRAHARIRVLLAFLELDRTGPATALASLEEVAAQARERGQDDVEAAALCQQALVHARAGNLTAATAHFTEASAFESAMAPIDVCLLHLNRGNAHGQLGDVTRARQAFERVVSIATEHDLTQMIMAGRHNHGHALYLAGDLPGALASMGAAEAIPTEHPIPPMWLDHGRVQLDAGLVDEAVATLESAAAACDPRRQRLTLLDILMVLQRAHRETGDLVAAQACADRARSLLNPKVAPGQRDRVLLAALGLRLEAGGKPRRIARAAERLRIDASERGARADAVEATLLAAEAHARAGDWDEVLELAGPAQLGHAAASLSQRLRRRLVLADHAVSRGDQASARRTLTAAARDLESGQARIGSLDLRTARMRHTNALVRLDLALAVTDGVAAAFARSELWRSATARLAPVNPPPDAELATLTSALRALHETIRTAGPDPGDEREAARLEAEIRRRTWTHVNEGIGGGVRPVNLAEARRGLTDLGVDLVSFFAHADTVHVIAVVGGRARLVVLLPVGRASELARRLQADLRVLLTRALGPLDAPVRASLAASAAELDRELLGGLGLGARPVVVVPTVSIAGLPWSLLPTLRAVPVTVARSATSYLRDTAPTPLPAGGGRAVRVEVLTGPGLVGVEAECAAITAAWHGAATTVADATCADVTRALGTAQVVHVAAHGRHHPQSPLFSTLRMSDGELFAYELQHPGVRAEHVTLSACEVGAATVRPGEEALGMASTLLSLGARSVVAPLAPVPDGLAAEVMTRYHHELARGHPSDEALAAAVSAAGELACVFSAFGARWSKPAAGASSGQ